MTLPEGWSATTIGSCSNAVQYGLTCTSSAHGDGHRYIRITDIQNRRIDWSTVPFADVPAAQAKPYEITKGDLLFARTGATVGKSYLVNENPELSVFASYLIRVRCNESVILPEFAASYFQSPAYWAQIVDGVGGTAQPNFNGSKLAEIKLALPPTAEQRRIVSKLDALTARLARTRAELDRTTLLLARLRKQALVSSFEDRDGIKSVALGTVITAIQSGKNMRCVERPPKAGERGVVKVSAVTWGRFNPQQSKTLPADYVPPEKARIRAGDLLISRANTLELVGKPVLVEVDPHDLFLSDKILRLVMEEDMKSWVLWFLRSPEGRRQIEALSSGNQVSMRNIGQQAIRQIQMPLPDKGERDRLLAMLETAFARADRLEAEAARARALLDRLESAILAKAFRGELLPQNPNDEPANVLLDRIRAERAAAPKVRRTRMKREDNQA